MIDVQERFHGKMCRHMNQYLIFERNMDLNKYFIGLIYQMDLSREDRRMEFFTQTNIKILVLLIVRSAKDDRRKL